MVAEAAAAPFHTLAWYAANDAQLALKATGEPHAGTIKQWISKPGGRLSNPLEAVRVTQALADERSRAAADRYQAAREGTAARRAAAQSAADAAREAGFAHAARNEAARAAILEYRGARTAETSARKKASVKAFNRLGYLVGLGAVLAIFFGVGRRAVGHRFPPFARGFAYVFVLAVVAYTLSIQSTMKATVSATRLGRSPSAC